MSEDVAYIPLANGKGYAIIDREDEALVTQYSWYRQFGKNTFYANAWIDGKITSLHRLIMGVKDAKKTVQVDHKDGNGLNCVKNNLRVCSNQQNTCHQRKRNGKYTSKYKGVSAYRGHWRATIFYNYKQTIIGYFKDEIEAAKAYNKAAIEIHGDFALINEIEE